MNHSLPFVHPQTIHALGQGLMPNIWFGPLTLQHIYSMIKSLYYSQCIPILSIYKITKDYNFLQWNLLKYFFYTLVVEGEDLNSGCFNWKLRYQSVELQDFWQNLSKYWRNLIISCTAHCAGTQLVETNERILIGPQFWIWGRKFCSPILKATYVIKLREKKKSYTANKAIL